MNSIITIINESECKMNENLFRGHGVEIELPDPESFLKVKETLTRIGISSKKDQILYQSCHILHKKDRSGESDKSRYAIMHFKELFILDGKSNNLEDEDIARRNTIVNLLEEWGLVKVVHPEQIEDPVAPLSKIKILPHKEKANWRLESKYTVGVKKGN
jgi:hypothetical protein